MRVEYLELNRSFCTKGKTQAWHILSFWQEKRNVITTFSYKRNLKRTKEIWNIKPSYDVCNKSQKEVRRELKKQGFL